MLAILVNLVILVTVVNLVILSNLAILGILVHWMIMVSDVGRVFTFSALGRRLNLRYIVVNGNLSTCYIVVN